MIQKAELIRKIPFKNHLINESKAMGDEASIEVNWIYDDITLTLIIKPTGKN